MHQISRQPAFELGQVVATLGALAALKKAGRQPGELLRCHVNREWGDLDGANEWFICSSKTSAFEKASRSSWMFASVAACRKR